MKFWDIFMLDCCLEGGLDIKEEEEGKTNIVREKDNFIKNFGA